MLDLTGDEIVHKAVKNDGVTGTLHPRSLPCPDEFRVPPGGLQGVTGNTGGGAGIPGGIAGVATTLEAEGIMIYFEMRLA